MNSSWQKAADILKNRGVVIIPSDSVYGTAALASNNSAVEKLYSIKKRETNKPSLLIVFSIDQAKELINFTSLAEKLTQKYWPGGLTIVGEAKNKSFSSLIYGEGFTLAIRLPAKVELQELAKDVGPFILPSANLSGKKPAITLNELDPKLTSKVDYVLKEPTDGNLTSTLVDIRGSIPLLLRPGLVTIELSPVKTSII